MKKTIMMLAAMAMVFCMASCSDDDDDNKSADLAPNVAGTYEGKTVADFAFAKGYSTEGEIDNIVVTRTADNVVTVNYTSNTWGTANFENVAVTQNDTAYFFKATTASKISMANPHSGGTADYDATLSDSSYVSKTGNRSNFKVKINAPAVMGGLTLTFSPNK